MHARTQAVDSLELSVAPVERSTRMAFDVPDLKGSVPLPPQGPIKARLRLDVPGALKISSGDEDPAAHTVSFEVRARYSTAIEDYHVPGGAAWGEAGEGRGPYPLDRDFPPVDPTREHRLRLTLTVCQALALTQAALSPCHTYLHLALHNTAGKELLVWVSSRGRAYPNLRLEAGANRCVSVPHQGLL